MTGRSNGGKSATLTTKSITSNGTYNASSDGADGYSSVEVDVYNPLEYANNVPNLKGLSFPSGTQIRLRNATATNSEFVNNLNCPLLKIKFDKPLTSARYLLYNINAEKVILDVDTSQANDLSYAFYYACVGDVVGAIDFSSATSTAGIFYALSTTYSPVKITFVPNTLSIGGTYDAGWNGEFAISTQISFANALNENVTGKAITGNALKNKNSIRGNSVLDETETYHLFVEDENGEMTLEEFITNVKGWTTS